MIVKSMQFPLGRHRQRGVSLFIVMVILLLSLLIVLGALAAASLNESIVGNQSDAQRAYGAAEALLDAARLDILFNGRYCVASGQGLQGTNSNFPGATCISRYPSDMNGTLPPIAMDSCSSQYPYMGICLSQSPSDKLFNTGNIDQKMAVQDKNSSPTAQMWQNGTLNGVSYNNPYIKAVQGDAVYSGNTSLTAKNEGVGGVYWVEVFPAGPTAMAPNPNLLTLNVPPLPDSKYPYIFRITAMARGLKSNTISLLRVYYIPYPMSAAAWEGA
jgi:type IV pilus assembly protein PilX